MRGEKAYWDGVGPDYEEDGPMGILRRDRDAEIDASELRLRDSTGPQAAQGVWRVGSKVPLNVYEGDRPVCQCHNPEDVDVICPCCSFAECPHRAPAPLFQEPAGDIPLFR
jgi:hypothetical protein